MPTAAEKAEARRKAILARGSDRLAKLTTSARGDEPAFIHDERPPPGRPANLSAFMGEDSTALPPKPALSTTSASSTSTATRPSSFSRVPSTAASSTVGRSSSTRDEDLSAWSQSQQDHFMRALMGAGLAGAGVGAPGVTTPRIGNGTTEPPIDPNAQQDPMMQLMSSLMGAQGGAGGPGASPFGPPGANSPFGGPGMNMGMTPPPVKQKTMVQKILPVVHLVTTFALMMYFILFVEPKAHGEAGGSWARWNELRKEPGQWGWSLKTVPFFTAFITLEILLQSIRIATGLDTPQLPGLLNMALPMLPPPIPSVVRNGLRYTQIFTVMLDDISAVIVALGLVIWVSGYISA